MNSVSHQFFNRVFQPYMGFVLSRGIYTAVKLQVAETLEAGPLTAACIATSKGIAYSSQLERLLRFLASKNIFNRDGAGRYSNNELSKDLTQSRSGSKIVAHQEMRWAALGADDLNALEDDPDAMSRPVEQLSRQYLVSRAIYLACKKSLFEDVRIKKHLDPLHLSQADFVEAKCKAFILHETKERWDALGALDEAIIEGVVPFEKQNKMAFFDYVHTLDQEKVQLFDDAMTFVTEHECQSLLPTCKDIISSGDVVADIGGGKGYFIGQLLGAYPQIEGILFDLPKTLEGVTANRRLQVVSGSFFEAVPEATVYHFKRVLHDWDDEAVRKILSTVRRSAKEGAKLVLHEMVLPQDEALLFDTLFMACIPGRQRTKEDFCRLLAESGWTVTAFRATGCWLTQIIASCI